MSKYLLFDADGTLYDFGATEKIVLKALFDRYNIPYSDENISLYHKANDYCWREYESGRMTQEHLKGYRFTRFLELLGLDLDGNKLGEDFITMLSENGIMIDGAVDFLESIKDMRKSMITNGIAKVQRGRITGTDTRDYFEHLFISEELHSNKPHKEYFDKVLDALKMSPNECLVIGDSENSDIQGAINAGIDSVYINFNGIRSDKATYSVSSFDELYKLLRSL